MSIQEKMPNGTSVNRLWNDSNNTELLAVFQYATDAEEFARLKVTEDETRGWSARYIVSCTYSGRVEVVGPVVVKKQP